MICLESELLFGLEGDQTAGKNLGLKAVFVANLIVEFGKPLERSLEVDDFHLESGHSLRHGSNVLNVLNDWNWSVWFKTLQSFQTFNWFRRPPQRSL